MLFRFMTRVVFIKTQNIVVLEYCVLNRKREIRDSVFHAGIVSIVHSSFGRMVVVNRKR